jgi:hypothetical protein
MNAIMSNNQLITKKVIRDLLVIPDLFFLLPTIIPKIIPAYIRKLKMFPVFPIEKYFNGRS